MQTVQFPGRRLLLGALVAMAVSPPAAGAATYDGRHFQAAPGETNDLVVTTAPSDDGGRVTLDDVVEIDPIGRYRPEEGDGPVAAEGCDIQGADRTRMVCRPPGGGNPLYLVMGDGDDRLRYTNTAIKFGGVLIYGEWLSDFSPGSGNDTITVDDTVTPIGRRSGGFIVHGGRGNDTIAGNVLGTIYNDGHLYRRQRHSVAYYGGLGNDTITCGAIGCGADGGEGRDTVTGGPGPDVLSGGSSRDGRDLADTVRGNDGNDRLCGGPGRDRLFGGAGNDLMDPFHSWRTGKPKRTAGLNAGGPGKDRIFVPAAWYQTLC